MGRLVEWIKLPERVNKPRHKQVSAVLNAASIVK